MYTHPLEATHRRLPLTTREPALTHRAKRALTKRPSLPAVPHAHHLSLASACLEVTRSARTRLASGGSAREVLYRPRSHPSGAVTANSTTTASARTAEHAPNVACTALSTKHHKLPSGTAQSLSGTHRNKIATRTPLNIHSTTNLRISSPTVPVPKAPTLTLHIATLIRRWLSHAETNALHLGPRIPPAQQYTSTCIARHTPSPYTQMPL